MDGLLPKQCARNPMPAAKCPISDIRYLVPPRFHNDKIAVIASEAKQSSSIGTIIVSMSPDGHQASDIQITLDNCASAK